LEDRRNGESSCNFGDETDQRVKSLMFMMLMMMMMTIREKFGVAVLSLLTRKVF